MKRRFARVSYDFISEEDGELSLQKGEIIEVIGIISNEWYSGLIGDRHGIFPANFISFLTVPDLSAGQSLMVATENFQAHEDGDLAFNEGEVILGLRSLNEDWWYGQIARREGIFPLSLVRVLVTSKNFMNEDGRGDGVPFEYDDDTNTGTTFLQNDKSPSLKVRIKAVANQDNRPHVDDELGFSKGDVVYLLEAVDDELFIGESNSKTGFFPLKFIDIMDRSLFDDTFKRSLQDVGKNDPGISETDVVDSLNDSSSFSFYKLQEDRNRAISFNQQNTKSHDSIVEAYGRTIYAFTAENPNELSFQANEIVKLKSHVDEQWCEAELDGCRGLIPTSFVEIVVDCDYSSLANNDDNVQSEVGVVPESSKHFVNANSANDIDYKPFSLYASMKYDFVTNNSLDLKLSQGDVVQIVKQIDDNWYEAIDMLGNHGLCPVSFVNYPFNTAEAFTQDEVAAVNNNNNLPVAESLGNKNPWTEDAENVSFVHSVDEETERSELYDCNPVDDLQKSDENIDICSPVVCDIVKNEKSRDVIPPKIPPKPNFKLHESTGSSGNTENNRSISVSEERAAHTAYDQPQDSKPPSRKTSSFSKNPLLKMSENFSLDELVNAEMSMALKEARSLNSGDSEITPTIKFPTVSGVLPMSEPSSTHEMGKLTQSSDTKYTATYDRDYTDSKMNFSLNNADMLLFGDVFEVGVPNTAWFVSMPSVAPASGESDSATNPVNSVFAESPLDVPRQNTAWRSVPLRKAPKPPTVYNNMIETNQEQIKDAETADKPPLDNLESEVQQAEKAKREKEKMREKRENVLQELLQTEKDYLCDLQFVIEAYIHSPSEKLVDMDTLFGNIEDVADVSQKLLTLLTEAVNKDELEHCIIGSCFLSMAEDMTKVYAEYCRNHDDVIALLLKYEGNQEIQDYIKQGIDFIRKHTGVFDLGSMLIKPVQRILKYPLLINELVKYTEKSHPDKSALEEAIIVMTDVATAINEYKRQKDLVYKYRRDDDFSLSEKISKLNMHSIRKKTTRIGARLSANLGWASSYTVDDDFNVEEDRFKSIDKSIKTFLHGLETFVDDFKEWRYFDELMATDIKDFYMAESHISGVENHYQEAINAIGTKLFQKFKDELESMVSSPLLTLVELFHGPQKLISKRSDKWFDYIGGSNAVKRAKDPEQLKQATENMNHAKRDYEALNIQLKDELPLLNETSLSLFKDCIINFFDVQRRMTNAILQELYTNLETYQVLYDFDGRSVKELTIKKGELVNVIKKHDQNGNQQWWKVIDSEKNEGYVPANYLAPLNL